MNASVAGGDRRNFECTRCGGILPISPPLLNCPRCRGPLRVSAAMRFVPSDIVTIQHSLWRYAKALAVDANKAISLGEGLTPLVPGSWEGACVSFKLEYLNPSGSFKDRGVAVLLSYLAGEGIQQIVEDSSGNAGASMALYSARAGMTCRILAPAAASPAKLIQSRAAGAEVRLVEGSRSDVAAEAMRGDDGYVYAGHNWHPHFIEGTKTLAYELWEEFGFKEPCNVVMPAGAGSNVLGCALGFGELLAARAIRRLPRLFAVQTEACAPLHAAFSAGVERCTAVVAGPTVAEGIVISAPPRGREILAALRASGGATVAVSEAEILTAMSGLARQGFFVEPTSAVAAAGLSRLLRAGLIDRQQPTVVVLTGNGLKAPHAWRQSIDGGR